jgi:hypothetical protein
MILSLSPYCTHHQQLLDVFLYAPFATYDDQEVTKWLKRHQGSITTHTQVASLFTEAYRRFVQPQRLTRTFRTGICPRTRYAYLLISCPVLQIQLTEDAANTHQHNPILRLTDLKAPFCSRICASSLKPTTIHKQNLLLKLLNSLKCRESNRYHTMFSDSQYQAKRRTHEGRPNVRLRNKAAKKGQLKSRKQQNSLKNILRSLQKASIKSKAAKFL